MSINRLMGVSVLLISGCAAVGSNSSDDKTAGDKMTAAAALAQDNAKINNDIERLARLWQTRGKDGATSDYPVGPGDVVDVTVPGMPEIKEVSVRITGEGTISLPFVGVIDVRGMTDKTLRDEIRRRLQENYMQNPQVNLFVKEFRSRQVAVIGAVQKPGLYNLASYSDTILGMISHAGGMNNQAAERILFIPAEPAEPERAKEIVSALPAAVLSQDPSPLILKNIDPIVINVDSLIKGGNGMYLSMPARPGDVIMVPGAGEVLVQGWIAKPGSYKITPGLSLLGVIAAAGGPMFPADLGSVRVIRTNKQGQKTTLEADLEAVKRGAQPDLRVMEGDVVDVSSSAPKLVAYGIYSFFTSVMHVGASVPVR